jgi:hypothetical protein
MTNTVESIGFSLNSLTDFEDDELARRVIAEIMSMPRKLVPTKFGPYEPLERLPDDTDPLIEAWLNVAGKRDLEAGAPRGSLLLLSGPKEVAFQVYWRKDYTPSFSYITGDVPISLVEKEPVLWEAWLDLIRRLVSLINPVYGDIRNMSFPGWDVPMDLQRRLPDIPWASIYGEPYVSFFGVKKIETAPFLRIEKLASGQYWLEASGTVFEPVTEETRQNIRQHLGVDSFMVGRKSRYKDGRAPEFDYSSILLSERPGRD